MIIVPNAGERELLKRIFGQGIDGSGILKLCLIGDNETDNSTFAITETKSLTDFKDVEVNTLSGFVDTNSESTYAREDITDENWTITSSGDGIASYPEVEFTLSGGDEAYNVYGYFVIVEGDTSEILWAEKFSSALSIGTSGGSISITLKLELD